MRRSALKTVVLLVAFACLLGRDAFGQIVGAILSGTVSDPSNAVVPNAKVSIRNVSTGVVNQANTNEVGIYNAVNLLPGVYQVNVVAPGFAPQQRSGLTLAVGERQILNMQLRVGDAADRDL